MLPPRLTARWAAAQIKDLVATKTPHNNHSPITLHVALCLLDFLQRKEPWTGEARQWSTSATSTTRTFETTSKQS